MIGKKLKARFAQTYNSADKGSNSLNLSLHVVAFNDKTEGAENNSIFWKDIEFQFELINIYFEWFLVLRQRINNFSLSAFIATFFATFLSSFENDLVNDRVV